MSDTTSDITPTGMDHPRRPLEEAFCYEDLVMLATVFENGAIRLSSNKHPLAKDFLMRSAAEFYDAARKRSELERRQPNPKLLQ